MLLLIHSLLFIITTSLHSRFTTVAIVTTNDIHGNALPTTLFKPNSNESYEYGGLYYLATMIEAIKQDYKGNVLYLDSGDQFEGSLQSSKIISNGSMINEFFNEVMANSSAIGNHEFDFGPEFLQKYMSNRRSDSSFLSANLESKIEGSNFLPNQKSSKIFTLDSGIKIGVIGLTTIKTYDTFETYEGYYPYSDYVFNEYVPIILSESKKLRDMGAHAIILNSHVGNKCTSDEKYGIWE